MSYPGTCAILLHLFLTLVESQEQGIIPGEEREQGEADTAFDPYEQFVDQLQQAFRGPQQQARFQVEEEIIRTMIMPTLGPLFQPYGAVVEYDPKYDGRYVNTGLGRFYLTCWKCPARGR